MRHILSCLVLVVSLPVAQSVSAVAYFWTNANGGAFDEPSHWTPFAPPATQGPGGAGDTVNFDLGASTSNRYVVTDAGRENSQLIVHNDSVEVTIFIDHELLSTGGANPSLVVGAASGDTGDLILSSGGASVLLTEVTRIANVAGSIGNVRVRGLEWNGGNLRVGHAGDGNLVIEEDATITSTNASIAHLAGSRGDVTVIGSWDLSGSFIVGREDEAFLNVSGGGSVTSNTGSIGEDSTGDGQVTVGGTWAIASSLTVGSAGDGLVGIGNGGVLTNADAYVGRLAGAVGDVVANSGSTWTINGRLSIGGDVKAGTSGGDGTVEILGGTVTVAQDITLFSSGELLFDEGSLSSPVITMEPGSTFDWTGGNLFIQEFNGSALINQGGVLAALPNSDTITVAGEFSQPAGTLSLRIAGDAVSNEYDTLIVGNTAFLGGLLEVELAEGFTPDAGDVYTIVDALNFGAGSFSNAANGERLYLDESAGSFLINYGAGSPFDPSQVVLSDFQPAATGDFDFDGDVDGRDFLIWQRGESPNPLSATDLAAWQANYGAAPLVASMAAVPEPGCLVIMLGLVLLRRR
jgi:T5SS/PEP-CTERM-associated repeat protein